MSMQLSIHCGPAQEKPTVDVRESEGYYWLDIRYDPTIQSAGMVIHGRSRAQCERLAAAWLGMWDEPAQLDDVGEKLKAAGFSPEVYGSAEIVGNRSWGSPDAGPDAFQRAITRGANMQPGLPDRIVRPDNVHEEQMYDPMMPPAPIHPEDGRPLDDEPHGVLEELDDTTQEWR